VEVREHDLTAGRSTTLGRFAEAGGGRVFSKGWRAKNRSLVLVIVPTKAADAGSVEVVQVERSGTSRTLASADGVFAATARLDDARDVLYLTRVDGAAHNLYALALGTGALRKLTDNGLPGVSFSGIDVRRDGTLLFSRQESAQDVWVRVSR
jgi:hypothetical protein